MRLVTLAWSPGHEILRHYPWRWSLFMPSLFDRAIRFRPKVITALDDFRQTWSGSAFQSDGGRSSAIERSAAAFVSSGFDEGLSVPQVSNEPDRTPTNWQQRDRALCSSNVRLNSAREHSAHNRQMTT